MLEQTLRQNLLTLARVYCRAEGRKLSGVSWAVAGDNRFLDALAERSGSRKANDRRGSFTVRKYDQIVEWFSANWPDGVAWPALAVPDVSRPKRRAENGKGTKEKGIRSETRPE